MVVHVTDALKLYRGDLSVAAKSLPIRFPPLKQLIIYVLPIPKHVPTAPELLARVPGEWATELAGLVRQVQLMAADRDRASWPDHPVFGRMSRRAIGVLAWKHTDHHLRQFGV
jgi:hypothetical protein